MTSHRSRSFLLIASTLAALTGLGACGSDTEKGASTTVSTIATTTSTAASTNTAASSTDPETTVTESTEPATSDPTTSEPTTVAADTEPQTTVPPTGPPTTTTAPDLFSQLPDVAALDVTTTGADPTRPTFTWAAAPAAASYQVFVQTADGAPLWAWIGAETSVVLGGAERAADVEGPTLTGPSRVRVYAFDAALTVVAVSSWVALPGA